MIQGLFVPSGELEFVRRQKDGDAHLSLDRGDRIVLGHLSQAKGLLYALDEGISFYQLRSFIASEEGLTLTQKANEYFSTARLKPCNWMLNQTCRQTTSSDKYRQLQSVSIYRPVCRWLCSGRWGQFL